MNRKSFTTAFNQFQSPNLEHNKYFPAKKILNKMFPQTYKINPLRKTQKSVGRKGKKKDATVSRMFFQTENRTSLEDTDV